MLICGDLQLAWSVPDTMEAIPCGDSTFFHIAYVIPPDSRLDYQLIIDSVYTTDSRNPVIIPGGKAY